jgi:hypothetical protein
LTALRALVAAATLLGVAPARAAEDPALARFLAAFRPALARGDAAAVADRTQLPFLFESEPRDREAFVRLVFPALFTEPVRACLAKAEPVAEDDRWVVFCGPYLFYFGRAGDEVRLLEFAADGEAEPEEP